MRSRWSANLIAITISVPALAQETATSSGAPPAADVAEIPQGDWSGFVALGPGIVPKYEGAKTYHVIPFGVADIRYKTFSVELRGLNLRANLLGESGLIGGPVIALNLGRHHSDGGVARNLEKIGAEADAGAYLGYRFGGDAHGQGRIQVEITALEDISSVSKGFQATAEISYAVLRGQKWLVQVDANSTYTDGKYARRYFGVSPLDALTSGLPAYRTGAGFRDVGAGITAGYQFDRHWGVLARGGYNHYLDKIADSPIVRAGSKSQALAGVAISYRF